MRPKKLILLVDADENNLSILRFLIENRGFRTVAASTAKEAEIAFELASVDLVLCVTGRDIRDGLIATLKNSRIYIPMILMVEKALDSIHHADAMILKSVTSMELIERIRVMSARKRGPRKGSEAAMLCGEAMRNAKAAIA